MPEDRARYLYLVGQLPRAVGQLRANLARRREMGILVPAPEIDPVVALFTAQAATGEASPFWVADERLAGVPAEEVESFREALAGRIAEMVSPAFAALAGDFDAGYRGEAPEAVGQGHYPGGQEAYRYAVRLFTTLDLEPAKIHARGLAAVAGLEAEMGAIREELGFAGTAHEFHQALRTDPRFLAQTPEEVGERLMAPIRRLEPRVAELFRLQPRAPYGVRRLDPGLEGSMTFGYYQQPTPDEPTGHYLYNGSRLGERPLVNAAALITHELVPGHHFQIALQMENDALPLFRRESFNSAFVEGWADYASELAGEMGLYQDPYERYGRLAMDMFLSVRLVVDTGMNALGWSREEASAYMAERVLESPTQIASETLRYAVDMPGQALAYKTGAFAIWDLRRRAEAALGDDFDLAGFHGAVLGSGSLPLAALEAHVDWWIEQERARLAAP